LGGEKVSVIIINFNGLKNLGDTFQDCVESALSSKYPDFEVLLVDNASTDGSIQFLEERFRGNSKFRIIKNLKNLGFAEGNNIGIRSSKSKYVALLNSDAKADPDWLTELVTAVQLSEVAAVQSKILQMNSPSLLDCAGGLIDYYGYHLELGRGDKATNYLSVQEVFYAKGAGALFKREALEKVGLFDSSMFMYFEEVDLCWRIWLNGFKVVLAPNSIVYHASGSTASKLQDRTRLYLSIRNHFLVLLKNYDLKNLVNAIAVSVLFELRNFALFLIRRKPLISIFILKALFWNLFYLRSTWTKRQTVQNNLRRVTDREMKRHMLAPVPPFPLYLVYSKAKFQRKSMR
jgi:GT2 family glycosyltransferase